MVQVGTSIEDRDYEKIKKIAESDMRSISFIIRRAIEYYLEGLNDTDKKNKS